jgi:tetratricopeptide (TPR) repeat protein
MAIKGSLREASLSDVLQLLAMGAKTGCLSVTDRSNFGYIFFDQGRIVYASIVNRRDRLGDWLVKEGAITPEQLAAAVEEQARGGRRRLGEILVEKGWIDRAALERVVRRQVEEAIFQLFTWTQGSFYFEPDQRPEGEVDLVSINPEGLLLEAARRVDEWSLIQKKIPSLDLLFTVDRDYVEASGVELTPEQQAVLPFLDGKHSVQEIIDETALGQFEVGKAIYGLVTAGFAHRAGRKPSQERALERRARVDEHRNLGIAFYRTAMYEEATREFRRVAELEPGALDAPFFLGCVALRQGDPRTAARHFTDVLDRGGRRASAFGNLAVALQQLERPREMVSMLCEAEARGVRHPRLDLLRAHGCVRVGDPVAAREALRRYEEAVPEDARPPLYYATAATAAALLGRLPEAIACAERGVQRYPHSAALLNNLGVFYERRGEEETAFEWYGRALEQDPTLPQAMKNRGDLLYRRGAYEEAAEMYARAIKVRPDLGDDVYAKLGNIFYRRKDRAKAFEMWERALALNPENDVVRTNLELVRGAEGGQ